MFYEYNEWLILFQHNALYRYTLGKSNPSFKGKLDSPIK